MSSTLPRVDRPLTEQRIARHVALNETGIIWLIDATLLFSIVGWEMTDAGTIITYTWLSASFLLTGVFALVLARRAWSLTRSHLETATDAELEAVVKARQEYPTSGFRLEHVLAAVRDAARAAR